MDSSVELERSPLHVKTEHIFSEFAGQMANKAKRRWHMVVAAFWVNQLSPFSLKTKIVHQCFCFTIRPASVHKLLLVIMPLLFGIQASQIIYQFWSRSTSVAAWGNHKLQCDNTEHSNTEGKERPSRLSLPTVRKRAWLSSEFSQHWQTHQFSQTPFPFKQDNKTCRNGTHLFVLQTICCSESQIFRFSQIQPGTGSHLHTNAVFKSRSECSVSIPLVIVGHRE